MNKATSTLSLVLGILAGIMGIEHGIGETLQGNRPTAGSFILSWPDSPFFAIMAGEPAMTLIPNYLLTGLAAMLLSAAFLFVLLRRGPHGDILLFGLLVLMLLCGAGFGPPILGLIAVLIGLKRDSPLKLWSRLPAGLHRLLRMLWPWSLALCLLGWMMLFPGASLIAYFTGIDDALLMMVPILIAFVLIPVTMLLGFSWDVLRRGSMPLKPS